MRTQFHKMRQRFIDGAISEYSRYCCTFGPPDCAARDWVGMYCAGGEL